MPKLTKLRKILSKEESSAVTSILQHRQDARDRLKAERERNASLLRPDGSADVANMEAQAGRTFRTAAFVERIRKLNANVWYERSIRYPDQGGLYFNDFSSGHGKRMVASMPHYMVPEFSTPIVKPRLVPSADLAPVWETLPEVDNLAPGWRRVLVVLMKEGLVTQAQVDKEFKISEGRSSQKWQAATSIN